MTVMVASAWPAPAVAETSRFGPPPPFPAIAGRGLPIQPRQQLRAQTGPLNRHRIGPYVKPLDAVWWSRRRCAPNTAVREGDRRAHNRRGLFEPTAPRRLRIVVGNDLGTFRIEGIAPQQRVGRPDACCPPRS